MITFFICLAILIIGYFVYGRVVEGLFHPDDKPTPAVLHPDGVDYVPMKEWKAFLIQLLNIAGLGPIFGALAGALWGPVVFLWIVLGTVFGGAVHDYVSGMLSIRNDGASLAELVGNHHKTHYEGVLGNLACNGRYRFHGWSCGTFGKTYSKHVKRYFLDSCSFDLLLPRNIASY